MLENKMENLFDNIFKQDVDFLLSLFYREQVNLCLPSFGKISSNRIFAMFVKKAANRLNYLDVKAKYLGTTRGEDFVCAEYSLDYAFWDEERSREILYSTPVALFCDLAPDGSVYLMNVYMGFDKFVGKEILRPAMYNSDVELINRLPSPVRAYYEKNPKRRYELCRMHCSGNKYFIESNVLFTEGDICTPQAFFTSFEVEDDRTCTVREYGEIVWDFKIWPTLY